MKKCTNHVHKLCRVATNRKSSPVRSLVEAVGLFAVRLLGIFLGWSFAASFAGDIFGVGSLPLCSPVEAVGLFVVRLLGIFFGEIVCCSLINGRTDRQTAYNRILRREFVAIFAPLEI